MNYRHIYMRIVSHAKQKMELGLRPKTRWQNYKFPNQYFEFHHILPKCEFPLWENRKSNIVALTAREHFFCHQLLTKIYPESGGIRYALYCFVNFSRYKGVIDSKTYQKLKEDYSSTRSIRLRGKNNPNFGNKMSQESKDKISKANKGRKWTKEQISNKRSKHYTNGLINISLKEGDAVPEGFWRGRTLSEKAKESAKTAGLKRAGRSPKNKGLKCFNNGKIQVYRAECPEGFVEGKLPSILEGLKGRHIQTEESIRKMLETRSKRKALDPNYGKCKDPSKKRKPTLSKEAKERWREKIKLAAMRRPKGRKWYNNGDISIMAFECPEGFVKGRLKRKNQLEASHE